MAAWPTASITDAAIACTSFAADVRGAALRHAQSARKRVTEHGSIAERRRQDGNATAVQLGFHLLALLAGRRHAVEHDAHRPLLLSRHPQRPFCRPQVGRTRLQRDHHQVGSPDRPPRVIVDHRRGVDHNELVAAPKAIEFAGQTPAGDVGECDVDRFGVVMAPQRVPARKAVLRVDVEDGNRLADGEARSQIGGQHGLARATFLLRDGDDDGHGVTPQLMAPQHSQLLHCSKELVLSPTEMGRADAASTVPVAVLMHAAGRAVARAARRFGPCRTLVLCGPGNNGGDGLVAARLLAQWGWPVAIARYEKPSPSGRGLGEGGSAGTDPHPNPLPEGEGVIDVPFAAAEASRVDLVIDAVFGAGMRGTLPGEVADVLHAARRILAVDVPSGLDGGTGQPRGRVRAAELTVTFARLKPGHLLLPGRTLCGETHLANIGLPDAALEGTGCQTWRNQPGLWRVPPLTPEDHKYTRGHVTVLGGPEMTGAARLSARAAQRGGAGMVTIAATGSADIYRAGDPGLIVSDASVATLLADDRRKVWVCGPGLGPQTARVLLPRLLEAGRTVVADADALGAFAGEPECLTGCAVLTPHGGEFARLFGPIGDDKLAAARAAAARIGSVVLLKGADTVIAAPDGRAAINDSAPPTLATAGAGDVLAGLIGALLGQGMPAWDAACAGAWLHGRAATLAGPGLLAEDIPKFLPQAIGEALLSAASSL